MHLEDADHQVPDRLAPADVKPRVLSPSSGPAATVLPDGYLPFVCTAPEQTRWRQ